MPIAIDAMGGDNYPQVPVSGAISAVKEKNVHVLLVGDDAEIKTALKKHRFDSKKVDIVPASEVIDMNDSVNIALKAKKDSSMRVCFNLHKSGEADGVVSAGHSGAMMAIGRFVLKTVQGIDRPCISALLPSRNEKVLLLDAGANIDCASSNLFEFAVLGSVYMQEIHSIENPRIGLLNIGSEPNKGDDKRRQTYRLLKDSPLNFVGNIEGKEFFEGNIDVVVTDGFSGNVLLKSVQGAADFMQMMFEQELKRSVKSKLGALLMQSSFRRIRKQTDYAEFGGAPLLGLKGNSIICHGASNDRALAHAIGFSQWAHETELITKIEDKILEYKELLD